MTKHWVVRVALTALTVAVSAPYVISLARQPATASGRGDEGPRPGQSATQLPDGRWLIVGGEGVERNAVVWDPQTGTAAPTGGAPQASNRDGRADRRCAASVPRLAQRDRSVGWPGADRGGLA